MLIFVVGTNIRQENSLFPWIYVWNKTKVSGSENRQAEVLAKPPTGRAPGYCHAPPGTLHRV